MARSRKKFDDKTFRGSVVTETAPGCTQILRRYVWSDSDERYVDPARGGFEATRWEPTPTGGKKRRRASFDSLIEAREWQRGLSQGREGIKEDAAAKEVDAGPTLEVVWQQFGQRALPKLALGTRANYRRYIRLHFASLLPLPVRSITPQVIDLWLHERTIAAQVGHQTKQRVSFKHELSVLRVLFGYFGDYFGADDFISPIRARHSRDAVVKKAAPRHQELTEDEFTRFLDHLSAGSQGDLMTALATVQYFQALRVSEVAGLYFEDINILWNGKGASTLRICRHVVFPRDATQAPTVVEGFKNASGGAGSILEVPLFPEALRALKAIFRVGAKGLVFPSKTGGILTYRQIQKSFDSAFEKAGLPYRGTHVLRHGGCRRVFDMTNGDLAIAQQLLGHADLASTLRYAKRRKLALFDLVEGLHKEEARRSVLDGAAIEAEG